MWSAELVPATLQLTKLDKVHTNQELCIEISRPKLGHTDKIKLDKRGCDVVSLGETKVVHPGFCRGLERTPGITSV